MGRRRVAGVVIVMTISSSLIISNSSSSCTLRVDDILYDTFLDLVPYVIIAC